MKTGKEIRPIMLKLCQKLNISEPVFVRILPLKKTLASISFKTRTLRLNSSFIQTLSPDELAFVIAHELLHLKYGKIHSSQMRHELLNLFGDKTISSTMQKAEKFIKSTSSQ